MHINLIIELVMELLFESATSAVKRPKTPRLIRYILAICIILFYVTIILFLGFLGVFYLSRNILVGSMIIILSIFIAVATFIQARNKL